MASLVRDIVARNLKHPQGFVGNLLTKLVFDKRNTFLERNAARLSRIQPHHKVLEVGFGSGHGLKEAYQYVKDGTGIVYGIETSELMFNTARQRLKLEIQKGKVDVSLGTVTLLPYNTDMFDSVFHCNCYYFWKNMDLAVQELYRVMKPGSIMISTMNLDSLRKAQAKGYMKYANFDPINYMWTLEHFGFEDVNFEYRTDGDKKFQVIFARINEKQAHDEDFVDEIS